MAEGGFLERFLGAEGESESEEGEGAAAGLDPVAAALATQASERGVRLDPRLASYLEKQARLIAIQTEHLHEQRSVQLSHLKLRRFTDRLKAGTQIFVVLLASIVGVGVLIMLYDAFTSRSVVVDAFKAPAALATRGWTGDVVASGVLDALNKLQDATRGSSKGLNTRSAWASDIKIEVPETGVSIGEIDRLLHDRFGHDLHIGGDLVQLPGDGLALTVRGDDMPASTFVGAANDLGNLTTEAAEYVYGRSQPSRYAIYLENANRNAEALAFLPGAFARADGDIERVKLSNAWGNAYTNLNQPGPAVAKYRLEMALAPRRSRGWWRSWDNIVGDDAETHGEEAGWREGRAMLQAVESAPKREQPDLPLLENPAQFTWDLPLYLAAMLSDASQNGGAGATSIPEGPSIADIYAEMHNPDQSARYMASSDPDDPSTKAEVLLLRGYAALDRGDAASALAPLEAFYRAWVAQPTLQLTYNDNPCFLALAYGLVGRRAEAEGVFKRVGAWSRCYAFHGEVSVRQGDSTEAGRIWAEGLRVAPDLPMVYLHRGLYELSRGDYKAAAADISTASAKAPHFADPLKAWGDVLVKEGRRKDALVKYDEALSYAPAWTELHQARAAAAR